MSERITKVPAISSPTDQNLRDVARQIKTLLDVREGLSGDPLDRTVTFRDLEDFSAALTASSSSSTTTGSTSGVTPIPIVTNPGAYDPTTDLTIPEAPEGFTATGLFASIKLGWLAPRIKNYAYTEIWSSENDALGDALLIGTSRGTSYVDFIGSSKSKYYWARFVTQANVTGPYNLSSGTLGETALDPGLLLASLTGKITESELYADLGARIDLIDAPDTTPGSISARIKSESDARVEGDTAIAQEITQLYSVADGNVIAIQQEAETRATETGKLFGQWSVKIDNNGYVSGFGLSSTANNSTPYSEFIVRADSFSISSPTGPGIKPIIPFAVQTTATVGSDGTKIPPGVYMDGAYIKAATITAAQIGSVSADTIDAGFTSSVDLESSVLYGSEFYIGGTATYEYNFEGQPTRKSGIAYVSNPNIALTSSGADFNVNYFRIRNGYDLITPFEVVNGVVRIQTAAIGDGTITSAKIADSIQSTNYAQGVAGWKISKNGTAEFANAVVRGDVQATSLNAATGTFSGSLNAASGTFSGELVAASGTFTGNLTAGTVDIGKLVGQTTTYTNPGTYNLQVPLDFTSCRVTLIGAGGGGATSGQGGSAANGPGGGGGGVSIATFTGLTPGTYVTVTVGAGGAGGIRRYGNGGSNTNSNYNGQAGGNTSVGGAITLTAGGGKGAGAPTDDGKGAFVGIGGAGTVANGQNGTLAEFTTGTSTDFITDFVYTFSYDVRGGTGGNSGLNYGAGGQGGNYYLTLDFNESYGRPGGLFGGGGGGSSTGSDNLGVLGGGAGANGKAIIEFYNPNGVVIRSEWAVLISALQRQGIQTT